MKRRIIVGILLGVFTTASIVGIVHWAGFEETKVADSYTYEGKMIMTADEYFAFKQVLAQDDVEIHSLEVYPSDRPLVIFRITIPAELVPFYGKITLVSYKYIVSEWEQNLYCLMVVGGITASIVTLIVVLLGCNSSVVLGGKR